MHNVAHGAEPAGLYPGYRTFGSEAMNCQMGYAIGHYARWVRRGAVRIEAESSDPLVQVTAFRDDADKRLVLVVINNAHESQQLSDQREGLILGGPDQRRAIDRPCVLEGLAARRDRAEGRCPLDVPGLSVTSLAVPVSIKP